MTRSKPAYARHAPGIQLDHQIGRLVMAHPSGQTLEV
jgi:hypothetical protein